MQMKQNEKKTKTKFPLRKRLLKCWQLYIFMLPAVLYTLIFCYKPMSGILMAFQDFSVRKGIWGSEWVGFDNFTRLFSSYWFPVILKNTLVLSGLSLLIGFPLPIILALLFNETRNARFRKTVQTVGYAPHFISTVVMCGMVSLFLSPTNGIINKFIEFFGGESIYFLQEAELFKWIYVISGVWQGVGWSSIIFFAALAGVDKSLHEAADIDGATRLQKIMYINIPTILPTIVTMFILQCGKILTIGYEKVYLLQTPTNLSGSEVISTYVYKVGLVDTDFSFSTAVNLFNTVINCILLLCANTLSKKATESSLF